MWHYQVRKTKETDSVTKQSSVTYCIVEVYPSLPNALWTRGPSIPLGSTLKDLIIDLQLMLDDACKYKVMVEGHEKDTINALQTRGLRKKRRAPSGRG